MKNILMLLFMSLTMLACGEDSSKSSSSSSDRSGAEDLSSPGWSLADVDAFVAYCMDAEDVPESDCRCLARELSKKMPYSDVEEVMSLFDGGQQISGDISKREQEKELINSDKNLSEVISITH